jgi:superoxide dismutase
MSANYVLPDLAYDYAALEPHLSARIVELHHSKHHQAYVDGANAVTEKLATARATGDYASLVGLEKTLAFHVSGHVLHSIYWTNLSPDGGGEPDGALALGTLSVVSATHPAFGSAVRDALLSVRFIAAVHRNRSVAQVVMLTVRFEPASGANSPNRDDAARESAECKLGRDTHRARVHFHSVGQL